MLHLFHPLVEQKFKVRHSNSAFIKSQLYIHIQVYDVPGTSAATAIANLLAEVQTEGVRVVLHEVQYIAYMYMCNVETIYKNVFN